MLNMRRIFFILISHILFLYSNEILSTTLLFPECDAFRKVVIQEDTTFRFVYYDDDIKVAEYRLNSNRITFPQLPKTSFPRSPEKNKGASFEYYNLLSLFIEDSTLTLEQLIHEIDSTIVSSLEGPKNKFYEEVSVKEKEESAQNRLKQNYKALIEKL